MEAITTIQPMATITLEQLMTANNMKKELIEKICKRRVAEDTHLGQILEEELPDFQRIDEERMGKILNNIVGSSIYYDQLLQKSVTLEAVRIYNSTLRKAPAQPHAANKLQPLPKEVPDWFLKHRMLHTERQVIWDEIASTYGTPAKPNLPTVEELMDEMLVVYKRYGNDLRSVVEHLHDKYSLHPREEKGFPFNLKEGDQVRCQGVQYTVDHIDFCIVSKYGILLPIQDCTPYVSAQEIIAKHNLSEEEVRAIREGKCT